MEDKKYQIFVSSTYTDLIEQRDKIIKTILEMYHIPIGMEMFSADDDEQWETIRKTIDNSDYYILVLGLRYGSISDDGLSFTEKEYNYALEKNKPILSFLLDKDAPLTQKDRDDDLTHIDSFRNKVLTNKKMADFWSNSDELTTKVSLALMKQISRNPQIGWMRADSLGLSPKVSEEIAKLSEENRLLREENESLKSKLLNRNVALKLKINNSSELTVSIPKTVNSKWYFENPIKMTLDNCKEILKDYIKERPKDNTIGAFMNSFENNSFQSDDKLYIENSDIQYINQTMINEYNSQLATSEEINKYNALIEHFERVKLGIDLSFLIENVGTLKASSVIVKIEFPNEVFIAENIIKEVEYPSIDERPPKPNLKEFVKKIIDKKESSKGLIIKAVNRSFNDIIGGTINHIHQSPNFIDQIKPLINKNSDNIELIDSNIINININQLMHTQNKLFDNKYILTATKIGNFEIKITIISEEMEEINSFTIPINVNYEE
ncbi:DUF4062 domain-containing protein [Malaciobacter sp. WC5094]